jgi:hypothetical protein
MWLQIHTNKAQNNGSAILRSEMIQNKYWHVKSFSLTTKSYIVEKICL